MTVIHVEVTQDDIDNGTPSEPCECPVAIAIARALPAVTVSVSTWNVGFRRGDAKEARLDLPARVSAFIDNYDAGSCSVGPFAFDLDVPDELASPTGGKS